MNGLALTIAALLALSPRAQAAQDAGTAGAYLNFVGSPRVIGMSRAVTAVAEGPDAVLWNPAGLAALKPNVVSLTHLQTQEDAYFENIGYAQPMSRFGAVGVNYLRMDSGSLPKTNNYNQSIGSFNDVEQSLLVGYGIRMPLFTSLAAGTTLKYSQQSLAGVSASGWGMDLGLLQTWRYGLCWGLRLQNAVMPSLSYASGSDEFPRTLSAGLAAKLFRDKLIVSMDVEKVLSIAQPLKMRFGAEWAALSVAKLRAGFDVYHQEFSLGVGYQFGRQSLDYATGSPSEGAYVQNVGYSYSFGGYAVTIHANPKVFSPASLNKSTTFLINIKHTKRLYSWELQMRDQTGNVVRSIRGNGEPPPAIEWDGTGETGTNVPAGKYIYVLTISDIDGRKESTPEQFVTVTYTTPLDEIEIKSL